MKSGLIIVPFTVLVLTALGAAAAEVVPLIVIDDVPLTDTIKNVTRQMELNYILDPSVPGSNFGRGNAVPEPTVNVRWTNITIQAALSNLLQQHKLTIVTNPATTVARITFANRPATPIPASQIGTNAGTVIPVLTMEDVALSEAIRKLAGAAQLNVVLDTKVRAAATVDLLGLVSFRWVKITARQALVALLDNYDLMLIEEPATASARIILKTQTDAPRD